MNNESKEKRIFTMGRHPYPQSSREWMVTTNPYMKGFLKVEKDVEIPQKVEEQGFGFFIEKHYSYNGFYRDAKINSITKFKAAYYDEERGEYKDKIYFCDKTGDFKSPEENPEIKIFSTLEEAKADPVWSSAITYAEHQKEKKFFVSVSKELESTDEVGDYIYIGEMMSDTDWKTVYSISKFVIDNRYPIWCGKNRKGKYKASLNKKDLEKFENVFWSFVNQVNNNRVYMIYVYYGYDYNYGYNPGIVNSEETVLECFHSVTEAKKSKKYLSAMEKVKANPDKFIVDKFTIVSIDEFGDPFVYDDVLEGLFNLKIFPVPVIQKTERIN